MRARIVALIAVLAAPQLASARPARVFQADVRAEPSPDEPVVRRFSERAEVSASEESKEGRRQPPLAPPVQKADLHPRLYVEDAGQLPRLLDKDPRFAADAESLANRRKAAFVVGGLGLATSIALTFAGESAMSSQNPGDPNFNASAGSSLILAGMATFAVGMAAALLVYPRRGEVLDLLNGWNIAHPEQPLELQPVVVVAATSSDSSATMSPEPLRQDVGARLVVPATGGPPVVGIPVGGDLYLPVTGGPPVVGTPTGP